MSHVPYTGTVILTYIMSACAGGCVGPVPEQPLDLRRNHSGRFEAQAAPRLGRMVKCNLSIPSLQNCLSGPKYFCLGWISIGGKRVVVVCQLESVIKEESTL